MPENHNPENSPARESSEDSAAVDATGSDGQIADTRVPDADQPGQTQLPEANIVDVVEAVESVEAALIPEPAVVPEGELEYLTYEQFGRRFFEVAVTSERIGEAFSTIAGEAFDVGPIGSGPGGMVKVLAHVQVNEPVITRQVGDIITFTVKLPLHIRLTVDLKVDRIRYDVDGLVTLPLSVRCAAPLQLRIEVDPPRPRDVFVDVNSRNMRGEIIRNLAQVDDEIRRVIARFVATEIDKPEIRKARLIDVDVELGRAFEGL